MKTLLSIMSNLQTHYHFKLDFEKLNQHTGGKWLIHGHQTLQGQSVAKPGIGTSHDLAYVGAKFETMRRFGQPTASLDVHVSTPPTNNGFNVWSGLLIDRPKRRIVSNFVQK